MKNFRAIILLFGANTISGMAQGISLLAVPWFFARNNDMDKFALIYILTNVVSLFWVPYAGVLVDRYSRKRIFLVLTLAGGVLLGTVALLGHNWQMLPWYLVACGFILTFFNFNIHYPNLYAFAQEITEPKYYGRITSALEVQGQLTTMLAGAAATLLLEGTVNGHINIFGIMINVPFEIRAWTIYEIFTLDAATYFAAFAILSTIHYHPVITKAIQTGSVRRRLVTGFTYLKDHPYILIFGVASFSVFLVILVEGFYLGPLYVNNHLHAGGDVYAASEMYYAAGALLAGLLILRAVGFKPKVWGIILLTVMLAAVCILFAVTASVAIFYFGLLMLGLTNAGTRVLRVNYLFKKIPNEVYGRTNSIFTMTNIAFRIIFLALFAFPFFLTDNNVTYAFWIFGVFLLVSAGVLVRYYNRFADY